MPFITSFTVTQTADCSKFTVNDTSNYDAEGTGTFSSRKLTIQKSDGTYFTSGGITFNQYVWPFGSGNSIQMTGLSQDFSFLITLALTSNTPQPSSIYTKADMPVLTCFTLSGFYTFAYDMSVNPSLEKNYKFVKDVMRLWIESESAKKAAIDNDFQASQGCLDRAKDIIDNLTTGY
jgi:hypothetical protein